MSTRTKKTTKEIEGDLPRGYNLPKGYIYARKKDTSKRVAYGCEIDTKNILPADKTRARNVPLYSETNRLKYEYDEFGRIFLDEEVKSVNTYEKRLALREKENMQKITNGMQNMKVSRKTVTKKKDKKKVTEEKKKTKKTKKEEEEKKKKIEKEEEEDEEIEDQEEEEEKEEKEEEKKATTPVKSRSQNKRSRRKNTEEKEASLSEAVLKQIERLGGKKVQDAQRRKYKTLPYYIPASIQEFIDHTYPEGLEFASEQYDIDGIVFSQEFQIKEEMEYKFLRETEDAILIGDGAVMIAARMKDPNQDMSDFNIYILDDNDKDGVEGPYKLSEFLSTLTPAEAEY